MTRQRPVALMVFGILNLILGSIWLLCSLCCGMVFAAFVVGLQSLQQPGAPPEQQDAAGVFTAFSDNVPGLGVVLGTFITASVLLGVMQLISGFGLIWIQNWARWLCALWGILEIATIVFILGYLIAVVTPSMPAVAKDMERWVDKLEEKQRQKGFNPPPRQRMNNMAGSGNPVADNVVAIAFAGLWMVYGATAFIFMVLPQTGKAIVRYCGGDDGFQQDRSDDPFDDDYERRRRPSEPPPASG